jgi:hypothetical protein
MSLLNPVFVQLFPSRGSRAAAPALTCGFARPVSNPQIRAPLAQRKAAM